MRGRRRYRARLRRPVRRIGRGRRRSSSRRVRSRRRIGALRIGHRM